MNLLENPIFQRDLAVSGPVRVRLARLPGICGILFVLWVFALVASVVASAGPPPSVGGHTWFYWLLEVANKGTHPFVAFLSGFSVAFWRFSKDRRNRLFEHLYFAALDSREIVNAKLMGLMIPVGGLFIGFGVTAYLAATVWSGLGGAHGSVGGIFVGRGYPVSYSDLILIHLPMSGPALLGGAMGGLRLAILGRRGKYLAEVLLQVIILLFSSCSMCCGPFALVNIQGYSRVINEFWWHVVYLDQEQDWGSRRL